MMSYEKWRAHIIAAAQNIASREFQEHAWLSGKKVVSSPDELYQVMMEDATPDLFFKTYGKNFTSIQLRRWDDFRSQLENYYDRMSPHPDLRRMLEDPEWDLVRQAAEKFVRVLETDNIDKERGDR
jgi:hypothetical protein